MAKVMSTTELNRLSALEAKFMGGTELTSSEQNEFEELARLKNQQPRLRATMKGVEPERMNLNDMF